MVWYSISLKIFHKDFVMIYTVKDFHVVIKAEVDVYDPADVGNLISGSSAFSKPRTSGSSLFKYC